MEINKYISVKISGNPDSNGGFVPVLIINNPAFIIEDKFYVGFDKNSYFFSIKTDSTQTVYKLIKNNVRSYGAFRAGSLVIAFSIPNGYALDNGYTPYDVLIQLKDEFLKYCMTCKDSTRETYEFNSGKIDPNVLDEKAKSFTISPCKFNHIMMNPAGNIGYVSLSELNIEKFFHDIRYPEFQNYKEVIIAEEVNNSNCLQIPNIKVPRPKLYSLVVDGRIQEKKYLDLTETISVTSGKADDPYFDHKRVSFSIKELIDGNFIDGIHIDEEDERVIVNTEGWSKPKTKQILVTVVPHDFENDILTSNCLKITSPRGDIKTDSNFSFKLFGKEIEWISNNQIHVSIEPNNKFECTHYGIYNDELRVTVKKKEQPKVSIHKNKSNNFIGDNKTHVLEKSPLPVFVVTLILDKQFIKEVFEDGKQNIKVKKSDGVTETSLLTAKANIIFADNNTNKVHLYIPKEYINGCLYICIENKKYLYKSENLKLTQNDNIEISSKDFRKEPKSFLECNKKEFKIAIAVTIPLICLIIGFFVGYSFHDPISKFTKTNEEKSAQTEVIFSDTNPETTEEDKIVKKLKQAHSRLMSNDLYFKEVKEFYQNYKDQKTNFEKVDKEKFDSKICKYIKDYYYVVDAIININYNKLKTFSIDDKLEINDFHISIIRRISNYEELDFYKILENINEESNFIDLEKTLNLYDEKKRDDSGSTSHEKFDCPICGRDMFFNSQEELNNHMESKHRRQPNVIRL